MGCIFSSRKSSRMKNNIRVVHLNGYVEDFESPVSVSQVISGKPSKEFLCTPAQLLSSVTKPLKPDALLEPGHIYFQLPYSTLQADFSPVDLASIAKKLTSIARSVRCEPKSAGSTTSPLLLSQYSSSPARDSPARSPNRFVEPNQGGACASRRSLRAPSWKPILDTIRERSFNRRSESDLQESIRSSSCDMRIG